jgi:hypothetical protein
MKERSIAFALTATLAIGATLATSATAFASSEESRFTSLTNQERTSRGGRAMATKSDLVAIARRHSQRMADRGYIYHNDNLPNEVSGDWRMLGENVGRGGSVDAIHQALMNSAPHRRNILEPRFNQVGIGTVIAEDGRIYVTEVFAQRGTTSAPRVVRRATAPSRVATAARRTTPPRPKPKPAPPPPDPQTVAILVRLIGLDARQVNPATGAALGI